MKSKYDDAINVDIAFWRLASLMIGFAFGSALLVRIVLSILENL